MAERRAPLDHETRTRVEAERDALKIENASWRPTRLEYDEMTYARNGWKDDAERFAIRCAALESGLRALLDAIERMGTTGGTLDEITSEVAAARALLEGTE